VSAFIALQRGLRRLPAGIPDRFTVADVVVASAGVDRNIVVAVAGQAAKLGILVEAVAAAGIRNQPEELLVPKVVGNGVFDSVITYSRFVSSK
jgi:hypothetical protein